MKSVIPLQQFKKCIILFMLGITCSALAYALYVINPVKVILERKLQIKPGSLVFELWKKPPVDVYLKVYIFNITNPVEFLEEGETLKLQELGPYVYKEILENHNVSWNDNGTISYSPKRTILYVPEMSVGDPEKDIVSVPNIPMLGISSALHDAGFLLNFPWTRLVNMLDSKPILNITVYDYLWGYDDSLVRFASGVLPNFVNFRKFGLLDRMYDEGDNTVSMNIKQSENMTDEKGRYLSIDEYNGSPGMSQWGYRNSEGNETYSENTICNTIRGATEGVLFPTNLDEHATFRIFRKAFCKAIPIIFEKKVWADNGLEGFLYTVADDFLDPPEENPVNECYCRKMKKCFKKGLSNITPCYYNIPAAMSLPHFLNADPTLKYNIEGLKPDPEKHKSKIILQPQIGIPIKVNSRLQINLIMYRTSYNSKISAFNDMTVPLFWTDLTIPSIPSDLTLLLKLALNILPIAQTIVTCLLGIAGVTMFVFSLSATLWIFNQQQEQPALERRDSSDLRMPLSYGQYTTIHILPTIKKITSKTDLFS